MNRIDVEVSKRFEISRAAAGSAILEGRVRINGLVVSKSSKRVCADDVVECELPRFVGRGGCKLLAAIEACGIVLEGRVCLDVGASTGGFTDCMLQHGAGLVHAVDVGSAQLHERLRTHPSVSFLENTNILDVPYLSPPPSFFAVDVSFVSVLKLLPHICGLLDFSEQYGAVSAVLVKPQFECGRGAVSRRGIVRDEKLCQEAARRVAKELCILIGRPVQYIGKSPVEVGNTEYLIVC